VFLFLYTELGLSDNFFHEICVAKFCKDVFSRLGSIAKMLNSHLPKMKEEEQTKKS
jgi:hypothetical protein